ncbi:MAG: NOL1/NOP2/sun family putative RNA methylase [Anaerolineae bacterium]|nr:NOL1/NOP2/sun family putative RNA methylase [Anaerolineae bacterium]
MSDNLRARLDRYRQLLSPAELARLEASLAQPHPPALRINTLKIAIEEARETWPAWYGWEIEPVPFCPAGWRVLRQEQPIGGTLEHELGYYYVQDAASMLPAELFSAHTAPLILDLAAAPGGKTTHLASRYADRGLILANDSSAARITALRSNLQTWGVFGALVTNFPGERFGRWFPETFDRVLLDAPCSGETFRPLGGGRGRFVSERERAALCQRQDALLLSAFLAARPGGEIVYATCTLAPEEDEAILDGLLRRYPGAVTVETVENAPDAPALATDGTRIFDPAVRRAIRLWPHHYQTSGFFAARLRKRESVPVEPEERPVRPWANSGLAPLGRAEVAHLRADWEALYGFDLGAVLDEPGLTLWTRERLLFAVPERLIAFFGELPHAAAGLLAGQEVDGQIIPSHELITRFSRAFSGARIPLDEAQVALWRQGRDLRPAPDAPYPPGTVVLLQDERGRFVGRGKLLRDRLRNLLPRRIRGAP